MDHTIAVDLAKSVFEVAVSRVPGEVAERHRLSRAAFATFFAKSEPCTLLMEACSSAHYWARQFEALGHHPILLPPHHVRPYRANANKTDRADAKALLEAFRNKDIHAVQMMAKRYRPAREQPITTLAHRGRCRRLAPRALSIMARSDALQIKAGDTAAVATVRLTTQFDRHTSTAA